MSTEKEKQYFFNRFWPIKLKIRAIGLRVLMFESEEKHQKTTPKKEALQPLEILIPHLSKEP